MISFVATSPTRRRQLVYASLVLLQWLISFCETFVVRHVGTVDTAYYYVIARHFARGRGLTDNVLWQLLHVPATVEQPAGTYWEVGWPLFLGSLMRVFGDSQRTAIFLCALLSGLLPLLTAKVAHQLSKRIDVAWIAGVLVCLQSRIWSTNVTPDCTLPYQLTCLWAISVFLATHHRSLSRKKLAAVGIAFVLPVYVRGEGFIVPLGLLFLSFVASSRPFRENVRRAISVLAGMSVVVIPLAIRNVLVLGTLFPPARSLRLWITAHNDIYAFRTDPLPSVWWSQGIEQLVQVRLVALKVHLQMLFVQIPWPLAALAMVGCVVLLVHAHRNRPPVVPLFFALSLLVPCLVVPLVANADRFVANVLPVLCICAATVIVGFVDKAKVCLDKRLAWILIPAAVFICATTFRAPTGFFAYISALRAFHDVPMYLNPGALKALDLKQDDVVLTDDPWRVAAELDVATVYMPLDGEAAIDALVRMYRPRFVLVGVNSGLRPWVSRGRFLMHPVATFRNATWYEMEGFVKSSTGQRRQAALQ